VYSFSRKSTHHSTAKVAIAKGRVGIWTAVSAVVPRAIVSAVIRELSDSYGDDSQEDENLKQITVCTDLYHAYTLHGGGSRAASERRHRKMSDRKQSPPFKLMVPCIIIQY